MTSPTTRRHSADETNRSRNATAIAFAMVLGAVALSVGFRGSAAAQTDGETTSSDGIQLALIDQEFDLARDGNVDVTYRITGDLATVAELTPPTTVPPTTAPPTTIQPTTIQPTTIQPTTTIGDGATPPDSSAPPAPAPPAPTAAATTALPTTTTTLPPPVELSVNIINYEAVESVSMLDRVLGPNPRRALLPRAVDGVEILDARSLIEVSDDGTATMRLVVPTDRSPSQPDHLEFDDDGIFPILVEFVVGGEVVASHGTVVERSGGSPLPTIDLSLLSFIADPGPSATDAEIDRAVVAFERMAEVADDLDSALTLSVPPVIATAATDTGARQEVLSTALVDDELIARPATPFDVSSAAEIDRVDSFVRQLRAGEDELLEALPGTRVRRDVWLVTTPISADGALVLRDLGVRYLTMPAALYAATISEQVPAPDRFTEIELPDGSAMPILIIDEFDGTLTPERTDQILASQTSTEWAISTIAGWRLEQEDAPIGERRDERSRLLSTPDLSAPDPRLLAELERLAATTDAIRFTPASELTQVTDTQELPEDVSLPAAAGPSLAERLERITAAQISLASVASMLPEDDERPAAWTRQLDSFVSTAYDDDEVDAAIDELLIEANRIRAGVIAPEPFTFTLTGRDGEIELHIGNRLEEPINVLLRLSSPRLSFPDGERIITLEPTTDNVIVIPVRARSNGTSAVTVEIETPVGEPLIEPVTLTSRVTALTGIGQVLTGGLILVLLTWWFSHWRARRRESDDAIDPTGSRLASGAAGRNGDAESTE